MGEYQVFALDWGISLRTEQKVELDMTHIAIRGHWIRPSEKAEKTVWYLKRQSMWRQPLNISIW